MGVLNDDPSGPPDGPAQSDGGPSDGGGPPVADRLRRAAPTLAPAERRVARALLTGYPLTGLEPLAVVAGRAGTSAPTVLRVVGKLGFGGWPEFQRVLRAELAARWSAPLDVMPREPASGIVDRVREAIRASVAEDLDRLAAETDVDTAAALLADSRHAVWTVGGRFSSVLAEYLALHLQVLRKGVHRVPGDPGGRHTALLDVGRRDVVVAFDYRRYQHDTIEFGTAAVAQGARLVLFTDRFVSPLAADADAVVSTTIETGSPFAVMAPALAAVETVLVSVVDRLGGAPRMRMERYDALSTEVWSGPRAAGTPPDATGDVSTHPERTRSAAPIRSAEPTRRADGARPAAPNDPTRQATRRTP